MKTQPIPLLSPSAVVTPVPKFHLVKGGKKATSDIQEKLPEIISDHIGLSLPKEIEPSSSETTKSEKSPAHLNAINDVNLFRVGLISATELRMRHPKTYKNWDDMKQRCKGNPQKGQPSIALHPSFEKFADFLEIMGPRPHPKWSLDRIVPTGPYSPDNVQWASKTTQSRNRTNAIYLTYNDETLLLVVWAERLGVNPNTLRQRKRNGWTDEEIIEGKRAVPLYNQSSHPKPRDYWQFTPWPTQHREQLEGLYQTDRWTGEHRLAFAIRYSQKCAGQIMEEIGRCFWPDDYTPSTSEVIYMEKLTKGHDDWLALYRYILDRCSAEFAVAPYRSLHLPDWVENKLSAYA